MNIVCSVRNLIIAAVVGFLVLVWFYVNNASPLVLFVLIVPGVLGVAFLVLWGLTTATGLTNYGKLFLLVYVVSISLIEVAAWWSFTSAESVAVLSGMVSAGRGL